MPQMTRRQFLSRAAAGSAAVSVGFGYPGLFSRALYADGEGALGREGRILVVLELAGGNDGLNTVIPYRDDLYYRHRPVLAVPARDVVRVSDDFGLHPALAPLGRLHDQGKLAVVHGVGYPNPDRSHFVSMDIWHTARPEIRDESAATGWLGRYLDVAEYARKVRLPAVALARELPLALASTRTPVPAIESLEEFAFGAGRSSPMEAEARRRALEDLLLRKVGVAGGDSGELDYLRRASNDAVEAARTVQSAARDMASAPRDYPATPIGQAFQVISGLIRTDLGSRLYYLSYGGFDTHAGQDVSHPPLLAAMAEALEAFFKDLSTSGLDKDVLVASFSEFGRRVRENASAGTDHGAAGPVFLVSGSVVPGFHGRPPTLADLVDGDLAHTLDFRSVYATIIEDWMGAPSAEVLGGPFEKLERVFA